MALSAEAWLDVMGREYLGGFISGGGGAIRFAVADGAMLAHLASELGERAASSGLEIVHLDLAAMRLHMLHNAVFAIAGTLPWDRLLQTRLETLVASAGYRWPDAAPGPLLPALAEANGVAPHLLRRDLIQALSREIWQDAKLTLDFRYAMITLLETRLTGEDAELAEAVMTWLYGTLRSSGQLKQAQIGRRIGRQNARAVLMSLCHWVRRCGGTGILLTLDIRQLHRERRVITEGLVYTPAAVMDCYEVLRQLIDDAEHFPGCSSLSSLMRRFLAMTLSARLGSTPPCRCASGTMCVRKAAIIHSRLWSGSRRESGPPGAANGVRGAAGRGAQPRRGAAAWQCRRWAGGAVRGRFRRGLGR